MKISKENIEVYLLDYMEGNLDPLLTAELMAFLAENPEYEKWLPEYENSPEQASRLSLGGKTFLKKDFPDIPAVTAGNFEEFCIAESEGILNKDDIARLNGYVAHHPEGSQVRDLYGRLRLHPDHSLVYPGKRLLKKSTGRAMTFRYVSFVLGAAASIALLLMLVNRKPDTVTLTGTQPDVPRVENKTGQSSPVPALVQDQEDLTRSTSKRVAARDNPAEIPDPEPETVPDTIPQNSTGMPLLATLEPIRATLQQPSRNEPVTVRIVLPPATGAIPEKVKVVRPAAKRESSVLAFMGSLAKRLNFWDAAETAISGFNYLTETQLSLSKTTDENGKLTGLALGTQQYIISGNKIK